MTIQHLSQDAWKILGRIRRHILHTGRPVWTARAVRLNRWWEFNAHQGLQLAGLIEPLTLARGGVGYRLTEAGVSRADLGPDEALPFALTHPTPF